MHLFVTVNNRLPVAVTAHDLKRNPEFYNLLESLTRHVTDNGMSKSADRDLAEVIISITFFTKICIFFQVEKNSRLCVIYD